MDLRVKKLKDSALVPLYQTEYAAAMDLHADLSDEIVIYDGFNTKYTLLAVNNILIIPPFGTAIIPTNIAIGLEEGYKAKVSMRSGKSSKEGAFLANAVGLIDNDYRGGLVLSIYNGKRCDLFIKHQERICQLEIEKYEQVQEIFVVTELDETKRGTGGFGSTGK